MFDERVSQQMIGIHVGTNHAPLLAKIVPLFVLSK